MRSWRRYYTNPTCQDYWRASRYSDKGSIKSSVPWLTCEVGHWKDLCDTLMGSVGIWIIPLLRDNYVIDCNSLIRHDCIYVFS